MFGWNFLNISLCCSFSFLFFLFPLQRFAPAAADMNGALYVAGGYDGRDYLRLGSFSYHCFLSLVCTHTSLACTSRFYYL